MMTLTPPATPGAAYPDAHRILTDVCDYYGVTPAQVRGHRRQAHLVLPRFVAAHLIRNLTRYSLEAIGEMLGGRDHATICHALRSIDHRMETDDTLAAQVRHLTERLTAA